LETLAVEKAAGARRSEGSHRSVQGRYVRMRARSDNAASVPYRRIRVGCLGLTVTKEWWKYSLWSRTRLISHSR